MIALKKWFMHRMLNALVSQVCVISVPHRKSQKAWQLWWQQKNIDAAQHKNTNNYNNAIPQQTNIQFQDVLYTI
jgi:hypothetical protein